MREGGTVGQGQAFRMRLPLPFRCPSRNTNLTSATVAVLQPGTALDIFEIREFFSTSSSGSSPIPSSSAPTATSTLSFDPTSTSRSTSRRLGPTSTASSRASRSTSSLHLSICSSSASGRKTTSSSPSSDDLSTRPNDSGFPSRLSSLRVPRTSSLTKSTRSRYEPCSAASSHRQPSSNTSFWRVKTVVNRSSC